MKVVRIILCLLLLTAAREAVCQTHIYERYADHTDLEVAYLGEFRLDSATVISGTVIMAKDSASWEWLKKEFHVEQYDMNRDSSCVAVTKLLRDKYDPTQEGTGAVLESYLLSVGFGHRAIVIYQYDTMKQYYSIIRYSLKKLSHEKN